MLIDPKSTEFPWRPTSRTIHLCIDMQQIFSGAGLWAAPWVDRTLPAIIQIAEHARERTVFTRFIPPETAEEARGTWKRYFQEWEGATLERVDPAMLELLPPLADIADRATTTIDKRTYSAFLGTPLQRILQARSADGVVVTGAETDVCVLASVLDAVDLGYPIFLITDAVCSSTDQSHDAVLTLYRTRFFQQIQTLTTEQLLQIWSL